MKLFVFIDPNAPAHNEFRNNSNDSNILLKTLQQYRKEETLRERNIFFANCLIFQLTRQVKQMLFCFLRRKKRVAHRQDDTSSVLRGERN